MFRILKLKYESCTDLKKSRILIFIKKGSFFLKKIVFKKKKP
jgi:hypothetical protein